MSNDMNVWFMLSSPDLQVPLKASYGLIDFLRKGFFVDIILDVFTAVRLKSSAY